MVPNRILIPNLFLILILLGAFDVLYAQPAEKHHITFVFSERPIQAFQNADQKSFAGTLYEHIRKIVEFADLTADYQLLPGARRDFLVKENHREICAFGVYKTEERERFANFSDSTSFDPGWVFIAKKPTVNKAESFSRFDEYLINTPAHGILLRGTNSGDYINELVKRFPTKFDYGSKDVAGILKMIEIGHGDFTMLPPELFEAYIKLHSQATLQSHVFKDIPSQKQYIMCSKSVPAQVIIDINKAIKKTGSFN